MYQNIAIISLFIFLYSLVSARLNRTWISGAVVFTGFGVLFGPLCLNLLDLKVDSETLGVLAEITLALVLFTDAANVNLRVFRQRFLIPRRLLLVGLPLTILLGLAVAAVVFRELTFFELAILATLLAPTDAALGKAVVTHPLVPERVRENLNVESGLNDGICVPVLFLFVALATHSQGNETPVLLAVKLFAEEVGVGILVGCGLSGISVVLNNILTRKGWCTDIWHQLTVAGLAIGCYATAQSMGGSGFIASFVGGLLFGGFYTKQQKHALLKGAEGGGEVFALVTWVIFGAAVVYTAFAYYTWEVLLYAVLSLTVIRMLPVFLSLWGVDLSIKEKLFIGWFGPRGLASIVFAVIVFNKQLSGGGVVVLTAACAIIMSVIAHGISALPLINWLSGVKK